MISIRTALPLLCGLMLGAGVAQAADIYKWVDAQGSTHYSDAAPKGAQWTRVPENISTISSDRMAVEAARAARRSGRCVTGTEASCVSDRSPASQAELQQTAANQVVSEQSRAWTEERLQRIEDCERNHGIDCAQEVDVELRAEAIHSGAAVIRQNAPATSATSSPPAVATSTAVAPATSGLRR
jgi:Domain of unknown function (DUF4124)